MKRRQKLRSDRIFVVADDILLQHVSAIVNPANTTLLGGVGLDGRIHDMAGHRLFEACKNMGGCKIGQCKVTDGFNLLGRKIIHAVFPVCGIGILDEELFASCYRNIMNVAVQNNFETIAFPFLKQYIYNIPEDKMARIAAEVMQEYIQDELYNGEILVCCDTLHDADMYKSYIQSKYLMRNLTKERESEDRVTLYPRGKEIFDQMIEILGNRYRFCDDYFEYAQEIVCSCSMYTYDSRIDNEEMYKFLEMAEKKNMKVAVVPNDDFLPGGCRHTQCDGWEYHLELVDKK